MLQRTGLPRLVPPLSRWLALASGLLTVTLGFQAVAQTAAPEAVASPTAADRDDAEARRLYTLAEQAYARGDYPAAVAQFRRAHQLSQREELLFNTANALERWGCYRQAARALRRYANQLPLESRESVLQRIDMLMARPAALDSGLPPCPGTVRAPLMPASQPAGAGAPGAPRATDPASEPTPPPDGASSSSRVATYTLLGVSAVGLAGFGYFGLRAIRKKDEASDQCLDSGLCPESASDALDAGKSAAVIADVALAVGVVSLATAAALHWNVFDAGKSGETQLSLGLGSVAIEGRF